MEPREEGSDKRTEFDRHAVDLRVPKKITYTPITLTLRRQRLKDSANLRPAETTQVSQSYIVRPGLRKSHTLCLDFRAVLLRVGDSHSSLSSGWK